MDAVQTVSSSRRASRNGVVVDLQAPALAGSLSPVTPAVTLALIGGRRLLRDATASLLTAQDGLQVLGVFESAAHFLAVGAERAPALLLLDCDGAGLSDWRSAVSQLSCADAEWKLAMLCRELSEEMVQCAVEHRLAGVVLKSYSASEVRAVIDCMVSGRTVMPAGWQRAISSGSRERIGLSPRHREILALIAEGRCNEEIAAELRLSPNTVKFHVRALYARLGVHNRVAAANRYAQMTNGEA
jgi:DNA-binding NarL/FixJ family response regulator